MPRNSPAECAEGEVQGLKARTAFLSGLVRDLRAEGDTSQGVRGAADGLASGVGGVALLGETADVGAAAGQEDFPPELWASFQSAGERGGWLASPSDVVLGGAVGQGTFGAVFGGRYRGARVAVKKLEMREAKDAVAFMREVEALLSCRSPDVCPLVAVVVDGAAPPGVQGPACWLLHDFVEGGTLASWLGGNAAAPGAAGFRASLPARVGALAGVARALSYMHALSPALVHRDVKPSNVLMRADGRALLSDLGLARRVPTDGVMTGETGTYFYMAPEVLRCDPYGPPADVYSFGVLLCEAATLAKPYSDKFLTPAQAAAGVVNGTLRPTIAPSCPPVLASLAKRCWHPEPAQRPTMASVIGELEAFMEKPAAVALENKGGGLGKSLSRAFQGLGWV